MAMISIVVLLIFYGFVHSLEKPFEELVTIDCNEDIHFLRGTFFETHLSLGSFYKNIINIALYELRKEGCGVFESEEGECKYAIETDPSGVFSFLCFDECDDQEEDERMFFSSSERGGYAWWKTPCNRDSDCIGDGICEDIWDDGFIPIIDEILEISLKNVTDSILNNLGMMQNSSGVFISEFLNNLQELKNIVIDTLRRFNDFEDEEIQTVMMEIIDRYWGRIDGLNGYYYSLKFCSLPHFESRMDELRMKKYTSYEYVLDEETKKYNKIIDWDGLSSNDEQVNSYEMKYELLVNHSTFSHYGVDLKDEENDNSLTFFMIDKRNNNNNNDHDENNYSIIRILPNSNLGFSFVVSGIQEFFASYTSPILRHLEKEVQQGIQNLLLSLKKDPFEGIREEMEGPEDVNEKINLYHAVNDHYQETTGMWINRASLAHRLLLNWVTINYLYLVGFDLRPELNFLKTVVRDVRNDHFGIDKIVDEKTSFSLSRILYVLFHEHIDFDIHLVNETDFLMIQIENQYVRNFHDDFQDCVMPSPSKASTSLETIVGVCFLKNIHTESLEMRIGCELVQNAIQFFIPLVVFGFLISIATVVLIFRIFGFLCCSCFGRCVSCVTLKGYFGFVLFVIFLVFFLRKFLFPRTSCDFSKGKNRMYENFDENEL